MYRTVLGICVITLDFDDFGMDDLGVALVICYELYSLVYTVYVYCAYDIVFGAPCIF